MGGRTVGRPINSAANPEPFIFAPPEFPSSNSSSSSSSPDIYQPFLTNITQRHSHSEINDSESERSNGSSSIDSVFGSVPTRLEAEYAITAFQRYVNVSSNFLLFFLQFTVISPLLHETN